MELIALPSEVHRNLEHARRDLGGRTRQDELGDGEG